MPYVKLVPFVVIEQKDEHVVEELLNKAIDDLVVRRIPVFKSGFESHAVDEVDNSDEILREIYGLLDGD